ncbi:hypothetical protein DFA_00950 [Cavenderia fasciculata]|uniref:Sm domain-containing protein n=1 Tax=Cavenderia fasciculata TaxID=261658 RepID=F4PUQ6_CACFS|nr:uncharacterized protein DFA_00950 [Cavenderia fasciculata]EGG21075.1 hypothetical protein DFA_00950 [Cavenderia fasciculata]|eukprot:XP_004358925.1 hypothetical protein DFA_00950 [Cavenderia fasciculata]
MTTIVEQDIKKQQDEEESLTESMKQVLKWMDRDVKIETHGGRKFRGKLSCFDQQQNVLLSNAHELMFGEQRYKEFIDQKHKENGTSPSQIEIGKRSH